MSQDCGETQVMVTFLYLTLSRFTWEDSLKQGLARSDRPIAESAGIVLIKGMGGQSLLGTSFPGFNLGPGLCKSGENELSCIHCLTLTVDVV